MILSKRNRKLCENT